MPTPRDENVYILLNDKVPRAEFEKEIGRLNDESISIQQELKELKKAIIENQQANYRRLIAAQAAVLMLILGTVITLLVKVIFHI